MYIDINIFIYVYVYIYILIYIFMNIERCICLYAAYSPYINKYIFMYAEYIFIYSIKIYKNTYCMYLHICTNTVCTLFLYLYFKIVAPLIVF